MNYELIKKEMRECPRNANAQEGMKGDERFDGYFVDAKMSEG